MTERKKTWREIDAARGQKGPRRDPSERDRERLSKSAAYSSYKSKLDQLFTPGGADLPESLKEKLGPQSEDSKARRERLESLKKSPGAKTLQAVIGAGDPLPADPRLLMSLMDVDDPDLLVPVLERLIERVDEGAKVSPALLRQRIQAVETSVDDDRVRESMKTLKELTGI